MKSRTGGWILLLMQCTEPNIFIQNEVSIYISTHFDTKAHIPWYRLIFTHSYLPLNYILFIILICGHIWVPITREHNICVCGFFFGATVYYALHSPDESIHPPPPHTHTHSLLPSLGIHLKMLVAVWWVVVFDVQSGSVALQIYPHFDLLQTCPSFSLLSFTSSLHSFSLFQGSRFLLISLADFVAVLSKVYLQQPLESPSRWPLTDQYGSV